MEDSASSRPTKRPRRRAVAVSTADLDAKEESSLFVKDKLRKILNNDQSKIIVFSGSGMSVSAGLSTLSGDLYAKAAKQYKLKDGSKVFCYSFLESNPHECFRFFKDLYIKASKALPTPSHRALKAMEDSGQLVRHYTLNFDSLASACGMSLWSSNNEKEENVSSSRKTVELHGNIKQLVCRQCGSAHAMDRNIKPIPKCQENDCRGDLRFRVLMYDDKEGHLISKANPLVDLLPTDIVECNAILWVGISFRQSASCQHFGRALSALRATVSQGQQQVALFIIGPNPKDSLENLMDGLQMQLGESQGVYTVEAKSDEFFQEFVVA